MTKSVFSPLRYLAVFAVLLILLGLTVAVAQVDWGPWGIVAALAVAAAKTVLIAVYFMHLQTARTTVRLFAVAGVAWLIMLLAFLLSDYLTRELIPGAPL